MISHRTTRRPGLFKELYWESNIFSIIRENTRLEKRKLRSECYEGGGYTPWDSPFEQIFPSLSLKLTPDELYSPRRLITIRVEITMQL